MSMSVTFWRFCLVGGIGFLTDAMLLEFGVAAGLDPAIARVISISVVLQFTYALHRRYTFRAVQRRGVRQWLLFLAANLFGCAVNYGVFLCALALLATGEARLDRMLALCLGTGVALVVNYTMNRFVVFAAVK